MGHAANQAHNEPIRIIRLPILTSLTDFQMHQWTRKDLDLYLSKALSHSNLAKGEPPYTGVLFDADLTNQGAMISPWSMGFGQLATKADWIDVVRELFQPKRNMRALQEFSQSSQTGVRNVWIGLPYPFEQQSSFGSVGRQEIDFSTGASARIGALSWWIDAVLTEWRECEEMTSGSSVRLSGFVWARGVFWGTDKEVLGALAPILHRRQLKLVRIQNQNVDNIEGQGLDADVTLIRPFYRQSASSILYSQNKKVELVEAISRGRGEGEP